MYGGAGDDILLGGTEDEISMVEQAPIKSTGGSGSDTIILRAGDGNASLSKADILNGFTSDDVFGLDGLSFADLTITQGSGDNASHTIISRSGEYLLIVKDTAASSITATNLCRCRHPIKRLVGPLGTIFLLEELVKTPCQRVQGQTYYLAVMIVLR